VQPDCHIPAVPLCSCGRRRAKRQRRAVAVEHADRNARRALRNALTARQQPLLASLMLESWLARAAGPAVSAPAVLSYPLSPCGAGRREQPGAGCSAKTRSRPGVQEPVQLQEVTGVDTSAKHLTDHVDVINFSVNRFLTGFRISFFRFCKLSS